MQTLQIQYNDVYTLVYQNVAVGGQQFTGIPILIRRDGDNL